MMQARVKFNSDAQVKGGLSVMRGDIVELVNKNQLRLYLLMIFVLFFFFLFKIFLVDNAC